MRASAEIRAEPDGRGGLRLAVLRSEAPLLLRRTADGVHLVGGAAGPLGGDELHLAVRVCEGARLTVRSVAAALAQPDPAGRASLMTVAVSVEEGASLDWEPEPLVVTAGARHRVRTTIELAGDARLRWRDVTVLGRHRDPAGLIEQELTLRRDGVDLLCQQHAWGDGAPGGWAGPAVLAGARVVASELVVAESLAAESRVMEWGLSVLRFAPACELRTALGATTPAALGLLAGLARSSDEAPRVA